MDVKKKQYRPVDAMVYPRFSGIRTFMRLPHVTDLDGVDFDPAVISQGRRDHPLRELILDEDRELRVDLARDCPQGSNVELAL